MSSERKIVRVQYTHNDVFKIPKGLDLEDKTQVKNWGVKYNRLWIEKVDGTELTIEAEGWIQDFDYKRPDIAEIVDADEEGVEYSDDEEEEEESFGKCKKCKNPYYDILLETFYKKQCISTCECKDN